MASRQKNLLQFVAHFLLLSSRVYGEGMENVFAFQIEGSKNCAQTVTARFESEGIPASSMKVRTNYTISGVSYCSVQIDKSSASHDVSASIASRMNSVNPSSATNRLSAPSSYISAFQVSLVPRPMPMATDVSSSSCSSPYLPKPDPNLNILSMTGADSAQKFLNLTGKGVRVAVIDTGIYYLHPALGGCFGNGCKVGYGYDLVGDNAALPLGDNDPIDNCSHNSHGTFVAGIIAANTFGISKGNTSFAPLQNFTGSAPGVTLGAYRVFDCSNEGVGSDLVAAAVLMAVDSNSDIINLSLGIPPGYSSLDILSAVIEYVSSTTNVVIVTASGNDGQSGAYTLSTTTSGKSPISVASYNSNYGGSIAQFKLSSRSFQGNMGRISPPLTYVNLKTIVANNMNADKNNIQNDGMKQVNSVCKGKPCLIRLGTNSSSATICGNARSAGATACIIYNYEDGGPLSPILGDQSLPSVFISRGDGLSILQLLASTYSSTVPLSLVATDTGFISSFSSRGLDLELYAKPDIGGVGGKVYRYETDWLFLKSSI